MKPKEVTGLRMAMLKSLCLQQFIGQFPFSLKSAKTPISATSVLMALLVIGPLPVPTFNEMHAGNEPNFFQLMKAFDSLPVLTLLTVSPCWLVWNRKTLEEMIRKLRYVEAACKKKINHRDVNRYLVEAGVIYVIVIIGAGTRWMMVHYLVPTAYRSLSLHFIRSLLGTAVIAQFVALCCHVSSAFRQLEDAMDKIIGIPGLERIPRLYEQVADAAQFLGRLYSPQIFLFTVAIFVELCFNLYLYFTMPRPISRFGHGLWSSTLLIMYGWPIYSVDRLKERADKVFEKHRAHIDRLGLRDYVPLNATLFAFSIRRSKINFSGCGFFNLERKFIFQTLLAFTTYGVLLKNFM